MLEAAAAGKPLVTTRVGGIAEIYGPLAGSLVTPNDASALAKAIVPTLDDPQQTDNRTAALRARVAQSFTVDSMVDGVLAAYAEALTARAPKQARYEQFAATQ